MKLYILGGTGFIGQYFLRQITGKGNSIICLSQRSNFNDLFTADDITYLHCVYEKSQLINIIEHADGFILAGGQVPDLTKGKEICEQAYLEDILFSKLIFDICADKNIYNVVFCSSIAVYGNKGDKPYSEALKLEPNSVYGASKAAVEKLAYYYNDQYHMKIKSLRIGQVFGARKNVVRPVLKILEQKSRNKEPIPIFDSGMTSQDFVYVKDAAFGIECAVNHPYLFGEFNIGIGREISNKELAEAFCKGFDNPSGIEFVKNGKEVMFHRSLDISKAKACLGYYPKYTLEEACRDMSNIYTNNVIIPY